MNRRGASVVEYVLILTLLVVVSTLVSVSFKQRELFSNMVAAPWVRLSGLLQNGQWSSPSSSIAMHPSIHERHISTIGETPR